MDTVPAYRARETDTLFGKSPNQELFILWRKVQNRNFLYCWRKVQARNFLYFFTLWFWHTSNKKTNIFVNNKKRTNINNKLTNQSINVTGRENYKQYLARCHVLFHVWFHAILSIRQMCYCTIFPKQIVVGSGIYGKRGIKINVTFSEGSPPELCVIVPIDKRGPWLWKYFHPLYFHIYIYIYTRFQNGNTW